MNVSYMLPYRAHTDISHIIMSPVVPQMLARLDRRAGCTSYDPEGVSDTLDLLIRAQPNAYRITTSFRHG